MDLSVIIPVYNGAEYVAQAVRSVQLQNYADLEIIVVDDGSTDNTADAVRNLNGVRYEWQVNSGPGAARNHGLRLAAGEIVSFCDADDLWTAGKLATQLPLLDDATKPRIVNGYSQRVVIQRWESGMPVYEKVGEPVFYMVLGSALIRKSVFDTVGFFEERGDAGCEDPLAGTYGEDTDWYWRAKEAGIPMRFHKDVVHLCLRHDKNLTLQRDKVNASIVRRLKKSLDRRRAQKRVRPLDWSQETSFE